MKIVNKSGKLREGAKGWSIENYPDSCSPKFRTLRVAISRELGSEVPERADIGMVGEKKDLIMLFPERREDGRFLLIAGFDRPKHRGFGSINKNETTARILDTSTGSGAWGAGTAFIAILDEGQRIVSEALEVWWVEEGELLHGNFNGAEYIEYFEGANDVDFI